MTASAYDLLGPSGPFAQRLAGYEARQGQQSVAESVERLFKDDGVLLCEAGTGIGKTFAYLVPALLSGRTVVISTATKALQDQIAERDLPLVQEVLGTNVPAIVMKGLGNYLCRRRYKQFLNSAESFRPQYAKDVANVRSWIEQTETGDLAELSHIPENARIRHEIAASSETRLGARCPEYERCFVTSLRREAEQARIIIVNHHLFFADLALRGPHPGRVLPDYDSVIFDEAHQIEDTAALFFGAKMSEALVLRILAEARRLLQRTSVTGGSLGDTTHPLIEDAGARVRAFFQEVASIAPSGNLVSGAALPREDCDRLLRGSCSLMVSSFTDLSEVCRGRIASEEDAEIREVLDQVARRLEQASQTARGILVGEPGSVTWYDRSAQSLCLTPVELGGILRNRLFDTIPAIGLLSATLSSSSSSSVASSGKSVFRFARARLGIPDAAFVRELRVESPFDYQNNCALYVPRDLPEPTAPDFVRKAAERAIRLIELTGGGAFVLTTSLQSVSEMARLIREARLPFPLFVQGDRPKDALVGAFRAARNGVLVATSSFWEGVDVPGEALRLVILEKLPFAVPTDPVFEARRRAIEDRGGSAFAELALPDAAITLKQGFGRLVRRATDCGIVSILDRRLLTRPYGKRLLSALPKTPTVSDLGQLSDLYRGFAARS